MCQPVATSTVYYLTCNISGEVILCDLRSGSFTHRLHGHDGPVQVTQWSPRNQHILVSGGRDHTVRMWDVRAGRAYLMALDMENSPPDTAKFKKKMKKIPQAHKSSVTSLCFTYDGLWLSSFSYYGDLRLWNSTTGENMNVNYGETCTELKKSMKMAISSATYPDLIFIPSKSKVVVYELLSGKMVNVLRGHLSAVLGAVYNLLNMHLYTFGMDRNFITWMPKKLLSSDLTNEEEEEEETITRVKATSPRAQPIRQRIIQDAWSSDDD